MELGLLKGPISIRFGEDALSNSLPKIRNPNHDRWCQRTDIALAIANGSISEGLRISVANSDSREEKDEFNGEF